MQAVSGQLPSSLHAWLASARLIPLTKKGGGVRPIAIGETLRRLVGKVICIRDKKIIPVAMDALHQMGVGTAGGLEAGIAAARWKLQDLADNGDESRIMLKVDLRNAFNNAHRSSFLKESADRLPSVYPWAAWLYSRESTLIGVGFTIPSQQGAQQGDPLGPLLFSLGLAPLHHAICERCPDVWQAWYLDDASFIGLPRTSSPSSTSSLIWALHGACT
jgi:hypothetical protein